MRQAKRFLGPNRFDIEVIPGAVILAVPCESDLAAIGRKSRRCDVTRQCSERHHGQLL
jgi:hypothetical protein